MPMETITDEALIAQSKNRDTDAFNVLVERLQKAGVRVRVFLCKKFRGRSLGIPGRL